MKLMKETCCKTTLISLSIWLNKGLIRVGKIGKILIWICVGPNLKTKYFRNCVNNTKELGLNLTKLLKSWKGGVRNLAVLGIGVTSELKEMCINMVPGVNKMMKF